MSDLFSLVQGALLSALSAAIFLRVAFRKNLFTIPESNAAKIPVPLLSLFVVISIYFGTTFGFSYLLRKITPFFVTIPMAFSTFLSSALTLSILLLFFFSLYHPIVQGIWKKNSESTYLKDIIIGLTTYFVSYPVVLTVTFLLQILIYFIFHITILPDQSAIVFIKSTLHHPLQLFLAILTIIILAPIIEELIFRGFIQSYLRRFFRAKTAILFSSLIFALFHYSSGQGISNLPIVVSIFVLANFLGFVYERQGSLIASISFHAIFNSINIANLYFFGV